MVKILAKVIKTSKAHNIVSKANEISSQKSIENKKFLSIWQAYSEFKRLGFVTRSGFGLYGIYPYGEEERSLTPKRESDLEHTAGMQNLIRLISFSFPEIIPVTQLHDYLFGAELHEIGEIETGDIPDDGNRNENEKDRIEMLKIKDYLSKLPEPYRSQGELIFEEFQKRNTTFGQILYCIDKTEAILQGLVYEKHGHPGILKNKPIVSVSDRIYAKKTDSTSLVDIFALSFFIKSKDYTDVLFFSKLIETAITDVRGHSFTWPASTLEEIYPILSH